MAKKRESVLKNMFARRAEDGSEPVEGVLPGPEVRVSDGAGTAAPPPVAAPEPSSGALDWLEFKQMVAELFRLQGYDVTEIPGDHEGGADLELRQAGVFLLVQCKYLRTHDVGAVVLQELTATVSAEGANGGLVVASADFTNEAWEQAAQQSLITLIDGTGLRRMVAEAVGRPDLAPAADAVVAPQCPICDGPMVDRQATEGDAAGLHFWGCANHPDCWGTREMRRAEGVAPPVAAI